MMKSCALGWMPHLMACYRSLKIQKYPFFRNIGGRSLCNIQDTVQSKLTDQSSFQRKVTELQTVLDERMNQLQKTEIVNKIGEPAASNSQISNQHRAVDNPSQETINTVSNKKELPVKSETSNVQEKQSSKEKKGNSSNIKESLNSEHKLVKKKSVKNTKKKEPASNNLQISNNSQMQISNQHRTADNSSQETKDVGNKKELPDSKYNKLVRKKSAKNTKKNDIDVNTKSIGKEKKSKSFKVDKSSELLKQDMQKKTTKKKLKHSQKSATQQNKKNITKLDNSTAIKDNLVSVTQRQNQTKKQVLGNKETIVENEHLGARNYNEDMHDSSQHSVSFRDNSEQSYLNDNKASPTSNAVISHKRRQRHVDKTKARKDTEDADSNSLADRTKCKIKPIPHKQLLPQSMSPPLYNTYFVHQHIYLLPYLEVCIFTGMLNRAELMFHKFKYAMPLDVQVFNVLLHGFAKQGDMSKMRILFNEMLKVGIKANLQSYAAVLECIGRNSSTETNASKCISQIAKEGLDIHDILSCKLTDEQRRCVVDVLEKACPEALRQKSYEPRGCTNPLVEDFYVQTNNHLDSYDLSDKFPLDIERNALKRDIARQVNIEQVGHLKVMSVDIDDDISPQTKHKRKILKEHELEWQSCLSRAFDQVKFGHNKKSLTGIANFYPFLCIFDTNEYVDVMLQTLHMIATSSEGNAHVNLSADLGQRLFHRYVILRKIETGVSKKINQLYGKYVPLCLDEELLARRPLRERWLEIEQQHPSGASLDTEGDNWSRTVILSIGSLLADIMLREINIDTHLGSTSKRQMIPGLYHIFNYRSLKTVGFVKPHPKLVSLIQDACLPDITFDSNQVPMLTPPLPWCSHKFGGYLFSPCSMLRARDDSHQVQLMKENIEAAALNPVLDSLNQLSNTPWIVNNAVLDVVLDIFRNGGDEKLNIPPPSSVCPDPPAYSKDMTSEEMIEIQKLRIGYRKKKSEMHSLRMNEVYKLSIANAFRDKMFWFPHNMDFRGRVYPYPPHFNHLGNDVTRSLLLFGRGKPLGEHGLKWLKIHLVNLTGLKKRASQTERLEYADSLMPLILDSAHSPLQGKKWWQTVENSWQTLAACKELSTAISSPDHTKHISHLPVHQDGSCNGLQHYAALGRDVIGAEQVNLYPLDVPQDVYNGVAQMVEELRVEDAANGHPIAIVLKDKIHRKVVKQTVMTVVYGVTVYGGRLQILKQLKEMKDLTFDQQWAASAYIVAKVFQSLRKMFTKTRQIQDWLTDSAWMIAKAGELVEWETPLGLPIVQPYQKKITNKLNKSRKLNDPLFTRQKPDTLKQKNAFPPNFIHSLDSSHMMLTSLYCQRAGITFSSVHDCFWTHPNTVDIMNKICRDQFVKLHSEPILDDLGQSLIVKFGDLPIPQSSKSEHDKEDMARLKDFIERIPSKGKFDLNNVIKSTYFFS